MTFSWTLRLARVLNLNQGKWTWDQQKLADFRSSKKCYYLNKAKEQKRLAFTDLFDDKTNQEILEENKFEEKS